MIRVRPIYGCRRCHRLEYGKIMEISDRPMKDLIVDIMDMAEPVCEPHPCGGNMYGALDYVGFDKID